MKVTYKEIAEAADIDTVTAENDRRAGQFDKQDLRSVALYIAGKLAPDEPVPEEVTWTAPPGWTAPAKLEWED